MAGVLVTVLQGVVGAAVVQRRQARGGVTGRGCSRRSSSVGRGCGGESPVPGGWHGLVPRGGGYQPHVTAGAILLEGGRGGLSSGLLGQGAQRERVERKKTRPYSQEVVPARYQPVHAVLKAQVFLPQLVQG